MEREPLSPSASGSVVTVRRGAGDAERSFFVRAFLFGVGAREVVDGDVAGGVAPTVDGVAGGTAAGVVTVASGGGFA